MSNKWVIKVNNIEVAIGFSMMGALELAASIRAIYTNKSVIEVIQMARSI